MTEEILEPQPSAMLGEVTTMQGGELPPSAEPVEPEAVVEPAVDEAATPFEVEGQKFATEKDAFEYLQGQHGKLKTERLLDEARLQGMQDAMYNMPQQQATPVPAAPVETAIDMDKFYENPGEYLKEMRAGIKDELNQNFSAQQSATQRDAQVWNDFTDKFPDLSGFRADVENVAAEHKDAIAMLARKDQSKAMEYVALKTREKFQRYAEALKPTRVLSNAKVPSPTAVNPGVNPAQNPENNNESVDFISQLRNHKRK